MINKHPYVLVTGASGLLGSYLMNELEEQGVSHVGFSRKDLDITDKERTIKLIQDENPTHIINCAAYTNVVQAEIDREICRRVNVDGVENLILASNLVRARLVHISTDFVFDGISSQSGYYDSEEIPNPINFYGLSKSLGEYQIIERSLMWNIVRTSWLYGKYGNNFVKKIIELAKHNSSVSVTTEEFGSPTYALDLSKAIINIIEADINGVYHLSNEGQVNRFDFAKFILKNKNTLLLPYINLSNEGVNRPKVVYLDPSKNPTKIKMRNWEEALDEFLNEFMRNEST